MTIMESAIAMNNDYVECSNAIGKIALFAEAAYKEYEINLKESALKVLKENGTDEDFNFLATEAANGYVERAKKAIEKIIESVKKFIEKCKENLTKMVANVKTKAAIDKVDDACKHNSKLKSAKVKYQNTDKQQGVLQQGIDAIRKKVSKVKAKGKATEADIEEIDKIEANTMKKVAAISVVTVVTLGAAVALYKHFNSKTEVAGYLDGETVEDIKVTIADGDASDTVTARLYTKASSTMAKLKKEKVSKRVVKSTSILSAIKSAISSLKGKVKSTNLETNDGWSIASEGYDFDQFNESTIEDLAMFAYVEESVEETETEEVAEEAEVVEESCSEGLDLNAYFEEICNDIFTTVTESTEEVVEDIIDSVETEVEVEDDVEEVVEDSEDDATFAESYMDNLERELFGEEETEVTTESYLENLEHELFDDETEVVEEEVATESTLESLLDEMENLLL